MIKTKLTSIFVATAFLAVYSCTVTGAAAETTLEKIKRTKTMTVGMEAAYAPFEFVQDGKIVGYDLDILDVVAKELGATYVVKDVPWQGVLPGVLAKKFDFSPSAVGVNVERAKRYAFSFPIAYAAPYTLKRRGDPMTKLGDLNGKVVATLLAGSTEPVARTLDKSLKEQGGTGFGELKLFTSFSECQVSLANGQVDAVIQSLPTLAYLVKQRPDTFELGFEAPSQKGGYPYLSWIMRGEDTDLRDFVSDVIKKMRADGRLSELQKKWFNFEMTIPDTGFLPPDAL